MDSSQSVSLDEAIHSHLGKNRYIVPFCTHGTSSLRQCGKALARSSAIAPVFAIILGVAQIDQMLQRAVGRAGCIRVFTGDHSGLGGIPRQTVDRNLAPTIRSRRITATLRMDCLNPKKQGRE